MRRVPGAVARSTGIAAEVPSLLAEVAQAFVTLGTNLDDIVTLSTLEAGVRYATQRG